MIVCRWVCVLSPLRFTAVHGRMSWQITYLRAYILSFSALRLTFTSRHRINYPLSSEAPHLPTHMTPRAR